MNALEVAEKAIENLKPEEFEQLLDWLADFQKNSSPTPKERIEDFQVRVDSGEMELFAGIDMSRWPERARAKALQINTKWREQHGAS